VTDLLPGQEPLKWQIREKSVSVFSTLASIKGKHFLEKRMCLDRIEITIEELEILLGIFSGEKTMSGYNFQILREEYEKVKNMIAKEKGEDPFVKAIIGGGSEPKRLQENYNGHKGQIKKEVMSEKTYKGQINGQQENITDNISDVENTSLMADEKVSVDDVFRDETNIAVEETIELPEPRNKKIELLSSPDVEENNEPEVEESSDILRQRIFASASPSREGNQARKEPPATIAVSAEIQGSSVGQSRKDKVFRIVKEKGRVTVGELASIFPDFSEKTLQRDLLEMVDKGLLKKEGDKRWRVYLLNS